MDFEPPNNMDDFEQELRQALQRRPAPPGLKRRLIEKRGPGRRRPHRPAYPVWMRLAASLLLVASLGGGFATWQHRAEQRKGEEARKQVLTALRITSHALNQMNTKLAARRRDAEN